MFFPDMTKGVFPALEIAVAGIFSLTCFGFLISRFPCLLFPLDIVFPSVVQLAATGVPSTAAAIYLLGSKAWAQPRRLNDCSIVTVFLVVRIFIDCLLLAADKADHAEKSWRRSSQRGFTYVFGAAVAGAGEAVLSVGLGVETGLSTIGAILC